MVTSNALVFKVPYLPDLEMNTYRVRYGQNPDQAAIEKQVHFLLLMQELHQIHPLRMSLRYVYQPEALLNEQLQIYLIIFSNELADSSVWRQQVQDTVLSGPLAEFFPLEQLVQLPECMVQFEQYQVITEVIKKEERLNVSELFRRTQHQYQLPSHYYTVHPFANDQKDSLTFLAEQFNIYQRPFILEIGLEPSHYSKEEISQLEKMVFQLQEFAGFGANSKEFIQEQYRQAQDHNLQRALKNLEDILENSLNVSNYKYVLRLLGTDKVYNRLLLTHFMLNTGQEEQYRLLDYERSASEYTTILSAFSEGAACSRVYWKQYWDKIDDNGLRALARLHRLATRDEVCGFFRLIVPDSEPLQGIQKEIEYKDQQQMVEQEKLLFVGSEEQKRTNRIAIPLQQLQKHAFVVGVPGSGKTTVVMNLLIQLWVDHQIPFLVIEPAKTEYRSLKQIFSNPQELAKVFGPALANLPHDLHPAKMRDFFQQNFLPPLCNDLQTVWETNPGLDHQQLWELVAERVNQRARSLTDQLLVLTPGREDLSPVRFNPFEVPDGIALMEHIGNVEAAFKSSIELFGPLPGLLSEAIENVYYQHGWLGNEIAGNDTRKLSFPLMSELYAEIERLLGTKSYSDDTRKDVQTALEVRLGSLVRRNIGKMLNVQHTMPSFELIMKRPTIIELDALNEEQANLVTMFLLMSIREYVRGTRRSGSALKHVVMIEEAHNIIGVDSHSGEGVNIKAEATKHVVKMLAEMRALGEGFIIADQLPTAVAPSAIKNTNIKIAHRIVSGDDKEMLQHAMQLDSSQLDELSRLSPGQSLMYQEGWYHPKQVREIHSKALYGIQDSPDSDMLKAALAQDAVYQESRGVCADEVAKAKTNLINTLQQYQDEQRSEFETAIFPLALEVAKTKQKEILNKYKNVNLLKASIDSGYVRDSIRQKSRKDFLMKQEQKLKQQMYFYLRYDSDVKLLWDSIENYTEDMNWRYQLLQNYDVLISGTETFAQDIVENSAINVQASNQPETENQIIHHFFETGKLQQFCEKHLQKIKNEIKKSTQQDYFYTDEEMLLLCKSYYFSNWSLFWEECLLPYHDRIENLYKYQNAFWHTVFSEFERLPEELKSTDAFTLKTELLKCLGINKNDYFFEICAEIDVLYEKYVTQYSLYIIHCVLTYLREHIKDDKSAEDHAIFHKTAADLIGNIKISENRRRLNQYKILLEQAEDLNANQLLKVFRTEEEISNGRS